MPSSVSPSGGRVVPFLPVAMLPVIFIQTPAYLKFFFMAALDVNYLISRSLS